DMCRGRLRGPDIRLRADWYGLLRRRPAHGGVLRQALVCRTGVGRWQVVRDGQGSQRMAGPMTSVQQGESVRSRLCLSTWRGLVITPFLSVRCPTKFSRYPVGKI